MVVGSVRRRFGAVGAAGRAWRRPYAAARSGSGSSGQPYLRQAVVMTSNLFRVLAGVGLLLGALPSTAAAQQATTVSGRVINEASTPLQGATVSIPTLNAGAYTNAEGRFSFTIPAGRAAGQSVTIVARRIGFTPVSRSITLTPGAALNYDVTLQTAATQLTGVIVTALGQTREKSTLGTAQQQITNADLTVTHAQNVMQQVQGKVSGVQITGAGTQGGSTNIIIRGQNSITGNNQPLFVVDGIPVSNYNRGGGVISGYDYGNAISDINPDDIESMTILKGPNAAALYGSRAANGVVVITTKHGLASAGKVRTEINTTYSFDQPSKLWDFQDQYGQGATGQFAYVNGAGRGVNDGADQSWGPRLDNRTTGCVFKSGTITSDTDPMTVPASAYDQTKPCLQFNGSGLPWAAHPDNVKDFFRTGRTLSSTIAVSGGTEAANARLSLGTDQIEGFVPDNSFARVTSLLSGGLQVGPKLSTNATLQYLRNSATNRAGTGYSNSTLEQFFWFGRQLDMDALRNYQQGALTNGGPVGREYNWNYNYHNNPFWLAGENPVQDSRDRFVGSLSATYKLNDWLNLTGRTGSDIFRFGVDQRYAAGNLVNADPKYQGAFRFFNDYSNENNTDLLLTADRGLMANIHFLGTVGGAIRRTNFRSDTARTAGISMPGIYNVANAAVTPTLGQFIQRKATNSVYGSAAFTYNNYWTIEGTARNDWSSTLPAGQNSYFYPSINTSIVLTDALPALRVGPLSYAKLRGSIARVGNDADPYQLATTYTGVSAKYAGLPQFTLSNTIANATLKPEITQSGEVGLELGFLDGRATFDGTYYDKATRDQIFNITISPTTGFASKAINAGKITNKGFEALLSVTPIQMDNGFSWTTAFNYAHNASKVASLYPGISTIVLGQGIFAEVNVEAREGLPYGTIYGQGFDRDSATGKLLTDDGVPVVSTGFNVLGNIQPNWTGGWNNSFSYKNWTFGALLDFRRGGQIISETNAVGEYSGVLKSSLRGREIDWNNPGVTVDGIDVNTGLPNTVTLSSETFFQATFPAIEPYIYDASYTKLREVRVGFELPTRWANKFNAQAASLSVTGRNLYTWSKVPNIDPEFAYSSNNFQGIEYAIPSNPRSIGFNVRITP
jgi:TonB-linked SusC/RagA family outer membrane protein